MRSDVALMTAASRGDRSHGLRSQYVSPTCNGKALTISRQSVGTRVFVSVISVISVVYGSEDIRGRDLRILESQNLRFHRDNDFKMIATVKERR